MHRLRLTLVIPLLAFLGCRDAEQADLSVAPAKAEPVVSEDNLLSIALTPEAQQRLGLATAVVSSRNSSAFRLTLGEIVNAPLGDTGVPTVASSDFASLAARQAAADGELARARAALELANRAYQRAKSLLTEEAGSARNRDEAAAQRLAAEAALGAAVAQRNLLGPARPTIQPNTQLWVRVPVFATDVMRIASDQAASIGIPGAVFPSEKVIPVRAVPTANPAFGTTDFYFRFDSNNHAWRVGQRVAVALPLKGISQGVALPLSALVTDFHGGTWVYRKDAASNYRRQRIEVARRDGSELIISRGLSPGDEIVIAGVAELFGYEFGTGR